MCFFFATTGDLSEAAEVIKGPDDDQPEYQLSTGASNQAPAAVDEESCCLVCAVGEVLVLK